MIRFSIRYFSAEGRRSTRPRSIRFRRAAGSRGRLRSRRAGTSTSTFSTTESGSRSTSRRRSFGAVRRSPSRRFATGFATPFSTPPRCGSSRSAPAGRICRMRRIGTRSGSPCRGRSARAAARTSSRSSTPPPRKGFYFVGPTEAEADRHAAAGPRGRQTTRTAWNPCLESTESRATLGADRHRARRVPRDRQRPARGPPRERAPEDGHLPLASGHGPPCLPHIARRRKIRRAARPRGQGPAPGIRAARRARPRARALQEDARS